MRDAAKPTSSSGREVQAALLEYFNAPGTYQLSLRQPAMLFESVREILQIAAGRGGLEELPPSQASDIREAANFFIRAALLYPGADHYAVLGLPPRKEPQELKERYRLLMRLIHPDFSIVAGAAAWPADAAVRVNRAYEVLSSPVLRREYDEHLASVGTQRTTSSLSEDYHVSKATHRPERRPVRVNRKAVWALGLGLGFAMLGMLVPHPAPVDLVQRSRVPLVRSPPPGEAPAPQRVDPAPTASPAVVADERVKPPAAAQEWTRAAPPEMRPTAPMLAQELQERAQPSLQRAAGANVPRHAMPQAAVAAPAAPADPARTFERVGVVTAPAARPGEEVRAPASATSVAAGPLLVPAATAPPGIAATRITVAAIPAASPALADVQPTLTQLLLLIEGGSGERLLQLLDREARNAPSAQALSREYDKMVRGKRSIRLSHAEFKGEAHEDTLVVTGYIRFFAGDATIGSRGERMLVRAEFISRGGAPALTGLSGVVE